MEIIETDAKAPTSNVRTRSTFNLSDIPGHSKNPKIWREHYIVDYYIDLSCSDAPWESTEFNATSYLQHQYDIHYGGGHTVEVNGAVQRLVSEYHSLRTLCDTDSKFWRPFNTGTHSGMVLEVSLSQSSSRT